MINMNKEEFILSLYDMGLSPIPLEKNSKVGKFDEGELKFYMENGFPREYVETWLEKGAYQNVGVLHGTMHGNLHVFDFDNPNASHVAKLDEEETRENLLKKGYWLQKTPGNEGRWHIWLRDSNGIEHSIEKIHNVEFRSDNHYTLIYPSIHPNGGQYELFRKNETELPSETDTTIVWDKIKTSLLNAFGGPEKVTKEISESKTYDESPECIKRALEIGAKTGERNDTILGIANWAKQRGIPQNTAFEIIENTVSRNFEDGKTVGRIELLKTFEQGYSGKYEIGCKHWRSKTTMCPFSKKTDCPYYSKGIFDRAELLLKWKVVQQSDDGSRMHVHNVRLAKMLLAEHEYHFLNVVDKTSKTNEIYYYDDGYYHPNGKEKIENLVNYYLDELTTNHRKNEVLGFIKSNNYVSRDDLEPPKNFINMKNGIYDIEQDILLPHSPEFHFINRLPIVYDKEASCPKIHEFFNQVFPDKYSGFIRLIQEMFGYTLLRKYPYHVAFILYGRGRNGKGVTINLLAEMLGKDNYSAVRLHQLTSERFASINLYGKMANIAGEISNKELTDTTMFKAATGPEPILAEKKNGPSFTFTNYAKLIFNANAVPPTPDKTFAFYQRWKIIVFSQKFQRGDPKTKENLTDELINDQREMSGLFNWAVEGLRRLEQNHNFTDVNLGRSEEEMYEVLSNPEREYLLEKVETDSRSFLAQDELYGNYINWCNENLYPTVTKNRFTRTLKEMYPEVVKEIDGSRILYKNIRYRTTGIGVTIDGIVDKYFNGTEIDRPKIETVEEMIEEKVK